MKKFLAIALSVVMLLGIIPLAAMATNDYDLVFDFEASTTDVRPGDVVDITVSVTGAENVESAGWQFELLLPEGVEYVANSGAINPELKATIAASDDCSFTESSKIVVCVGTDGLVNLDQKNKILTFQVKVGESAKTGDKFEIAAYDWTIMDINTDIYPEDKVQINYTTLTVLPPEPEIIFDFVPAKNQAVAGEEVDVTVLVTCTDVVESAGWQFELTFPEGLEYVENSGAINPELKATISASDDCSFTESSKIVVCVGTDGLTNLAQKNVILTYKVKVADDAAVSTKFDLAAYDWTIMDINTDIYPEDRVQINYGSIEVVDHVCTADKLTAEEAVDPTCTEDGNIAYYECECGLKYADADALQLAGDVVIAALGHTQGEVVVENEVAADCENEGSYDEVVYCSVCGEELSRDTITTDALGHTEGEAVVENEVAADCENEGSYDEVVYCTVCGEELSRDTITTDALGHNYEAVVTAPDCVNAGFTTYTCSVCGDSYVADEVAALGHTEGEVVYENVSDATCTEGGSGDAVIYCSVCGEELSRETSEVPALGHTEGEAVEENRVEADCVNEGSFDTVVYCSVCGEELSRETTTIDALGHTEGEAVEENRVEADCVNAGSYDTVVYCTVCGEELSRETTTIDALGHDYEAVVTEPDCTEQGYTTYTCSVCGDSYVADYVDALGHTEADEWVEDDTVRGQWNLLCSVCGEILDSEIRLVPVDGVKLDQTSVRTKYVRKAPAFTLTAIVSPEDAEKLPYTVTWTSSNEKVATVDEDGNVTTHHRGDAVITATVTMEDGTTYTASCEVEVYYTFCQWLIWFFLIGCAWYFV